jgi:hypothetical protein
MSVIGHCPDHGYVEPNNHECGNPSVELIEVVPAEHLQRAKRDGYEQGYAVGVATAKGAVSRVAELQEALRSYGIHAESCPCHRLFPNCTCGLDAALNGGR